MLYPSTLSVSGETFEALLTDIANSLRIHGFEHIAMIGDSGGNQRSMNFSQLSLIQEFSIPQVLYRSL